jgi:uncharacterized protein (TIGR02391 family)
MTPDNTWITEIDDINLLAVLEVILDVKEVLDFKANSLSIQIPLRPAILRFPELQPSKMPSVVNRYEELRLRAAEFLREKGIFSLVIKGTALTSPNINIVTTKPGVLAIATLLRQELGRRKQPEVKLPKTENPSFWSNLHPKVVELGKPRFEANHFADCVEASFKEVNDRVKSMVKTRTGQENDGVPLMKQALSPNGPIISLADMSTSSGKSEQQGYMEIFAGAMTGIRNPKAHSNIVIDEKRAIHLLYLASLLMYKLDDAR